MEKNLADPLSMSQLAAAAALSVQMQRLFRKHTRRIPAQIYDSLQMKPALWLVQNSDKTLTQIAGFSQHDPKASTQRGSVSLREGLTSWDRMLTPRIHLQRVQVDLGRCVLKFYLSRPDDPSNARARLVLQLGLAPFAQ